MKTTEKKSRIEIPEVIYLHLRTKMKEAGEYKTVGEYILHQLDVLTITTCENNILAKVNKELKETNEQLLNERRQASIQTSVSEARANSLQKELQAKENIESELRNLKDKYTTLQKANEAKDIEIRKLNSEKILVEKKVSLLTSENFDLIRSLVKVRTFWGRLKNLFS